MTGSHIVIVDDDDAVRSYMRLFAEDLGHTVSEVNNGEEYLALNPKHQVDLILLDILMPKMHGAALLTTLAQNKACEKIIVISSQKQVTIKTSISLAKNSGLKIMGYLRKPVDGDMLKAAISEALDPSVKV